MIEESEDRPDWTIGVILAAGIGARLGLNVPKQMLKVAGKPIIEHAIGVFDRSPLVDEILVVITPGWESAVQEITGDKYPKLTTVLAGGRTRNDSTRVALDAIARRNAKVVLHDAVRPLLDERIIEDCVNGLDDHDAIDVVIPSADTLVEVDEDEFIVSIPDRSRFRRGQTPQAFRISVLREAYGLAALDPDFAATDDCGVVLHYLPAARIKTVLGAEHNIKVTYPVDLYIADRLFQLASRPSGRGVHATEDRPLDGRVVVVFGATQGIGAEIAQLVEDGGGTVVRHGRSADLDVRDATQVAAALADAATRFGRIDAVVLTAGVLLTGPIVDATEESIEQTVGVNYLGPVNVARASFPHLVRTRGHLLFFTSSSYTRGRGNYAMYSSTKAAIVNLTQALSEEWLEEGVRVNVVNPERTATPMRSRAFGTEPPGSLLSAVAVARTSVDVLLSNHTGQIFDVRMEEPAGSPTA